MSTCLDIIGHASNSVKGKRYLEIGVQLTLSQISMGQNWDAPIWQCMYMFLRVLYLLTRMIFIIYARNPLFGPDVVIKYGVTQWESCLTISPIPLFVNNLVRNTLHVYAHGYNRRTLLIKLITYVVTWHHCWSEISAHGRYSLCILLFALIPNMYIHLLTKWYSTYEKTAVSPPPSPLELTVVAD